MVTAIETLADEKINVDFVRRRLLDEIIKRDSIKTSTTDITLNRGATAFGSNGKRCFILKAEQSQEKFKRSQYKAYHTTTADNGESETDGDKVEKHVAFLSEKPAISNPTM